jgi:hypothetical protein
MLLLKPFKFLLKLEFLLKQCPSLGQSSSSSASSLSSSSLASQTNSTSKIQISSAPAPLSSQTQSSTLLLQPPGQSQLASAQSQLQGAGQSQQQQFLGVSSAHHHHHHRDRDRDHHHHHHHVHFNSSSPVKLTERSRAALVALLVLIIENYHLREEKKKAAVRNQQQSRRQSTVKIDESAQLSPELLNYLLVIFENLPNFKWIEDTLAASLSSSQTSNSKHKLPTTETFTFWYNTGLTELAHIYPAYRARILQSQYKLIGDIIKSLNTSNMLNKIDIVKTITTSSLVVNVDANKACRLLVPVLIGVLRSFGRVSGLEGTSILTLIFHDNYLAKFVQASSSTTTAGCSQMKSSPTNDSIASSNSATVAAVNSQFQQKLTSRSPQSTSLNLSDFLNPYLGYGELPVTALSTTTATSTTSSSNLSHSVFCQNPNLEAYFAHTIGSSFYNGQAAYALQLSPVELKELFQLIKKLFVKSIINQINKYLNDFLTQQQVGKYERLLSSRMRVNFAN